jgi:hypothetical protein
MLLADIRAVFDARGAKDISSADLVAALVAMHDRPWGECNHGKALTQNLLARRLKPFGVFTKDVGPEQNRVKRYTLESLVDAFARYIPPSATAHQRSGNTINHLDEKQTAHSFYGCAGANSYNQLNLNKMRGCADENAQTGDARECADDLAAATVPKPPFSTRERI